MFKLPHNCTHLTCWQSNAQNSLSQVSTVPEPWTSRCSSWISKRQRNQRSTCLWIDSLSSNFCLLICIQISQEADQVVWCSHLLKNFPQFVEIHTVKDFGIINKAEENVFLELPCFFSDPVDIGNLISGSSGFSKTSLNIGSLIAEA